MLKKIFFLIVTSLLVFPDINAAGTLNLNPNPPGQSVRLIFIHHSTGENWLNDENGALGIALRDNNYFVSDTNYGWGPDSIGDYTDIGHWWLWFRGTSSTTYMNALYKESGQNSSYSRASVTPSGENEIVMFKSCFTNAALQGSANDLVPSIASNPLRGQDYGSEYHTVANAKGIYIDILEYFKTQKNKLFVLATAPPQSDSTYADNSRALSNWLVNDWLKDYPYRNVAVFDFYNVLTTNGGNSNTNDLSRTSGNHHRWWNNAVQHKTDGDDDSNPNILEYPSDDDHPSRAGNLKATGEFPPLLNIYYNCWKGTGSCPDIGVGGKCSSTLYSDFTLKIPFINFNNGMSYYSADLVYVPTSDGNIMFKVTSAGQATQGSCSSPATLSESSGKYVLHMPVLIFGTMSYWADIEYVSTSDGLLWFKLTNFGQS